MFSGQDDSHARQGKGTQEVGDEGAANQQLYPTERRTGTYSIHDHHRLETQVLAVYVC